MVELEESLLTSVGSFPRLDNSSTERSIELFAELQLQLCYDVLVDGEPRSGMIEYFVDGIKGLGYSKGKPAILEKIEVPNVNEFSKIKDYLHLKGYLERRNVEKRIKVAVTGPVTLGVTCAIGGLGPYRYIGDPNIYHDLASALNPIARKLQELGAIVQIDEPGLAAGYMNPFLAVRYINRAVEGLEPKRTLVHVCGKISKNLHKAFLELENVGIFSHAFGEAIQNLDVIEPQEMRLSDKKLALGCARTDIKNMSEISSVDEIISIIDRAKSAVGEDLIVYLHPDCGLRNASQEMAKKILKNLSLAREKLRKS